MSDRCIGVRRIVVAVLTCALLGIADRSEADCYCSAGPACTDAWKAAAIFVGRVQRITPRRAPKNEWGRPNQLVRLEVLETFRGFDTGAPATIDILTSDDSRLCGFPFTVGDTYLVYAIGPSEPYMRTSTCTRTRPLAHADEDLAYLRSLSTTSAPTGRVFGRVEFGDPTKRRHSRSDLERACNCKT